MSDTKMQILYDFTYKVEEQSNPIYGDRTQNIGFLLGRGIYKRTQTKFLRHWKYSVSCFYNSFVGTNNHQNISK